MKRLLAFIAFATLLALLAPAVQAQCAARTPTAQPAPPQKEYANITNFLRVNEQICTGGQPALEDLEKMKAEGIHAIINLRQASEYNFAEEEAKAKEVGLRYVHIPVNSRELKDEYADAFLKATDDPANRPAFIHCTTANRVGAFWMIRRVLRDGWSLEKAEEEARKIGLHNDVLIAFAKDYITRHKP
jgi:uncharacterized protein (TIGR01244 family)